MNKKYKKNKKCTICGAKLKHLGLNKWMCDQPFKNCEFSTKVVYLIMSEEESE